MVERSQPGVVQVILVAAAVVVVVLGAALATSLLPTAAREGIIDSPVMIVVLIVGTGWLLWRIARGGPPADADR